MSETENNRSRQMAAMYFNEGMTQTEIAKQFGISPQTVSKHLNKEDILEEFDKRRKAQTLRAKIKLAAATERAVEVQAAYLDMELPINLEYLRQNAARDILDRAGVKTEAGEMGNSIEVIFKEPIRPGIPTEMAEDDSDDQPA